MREKDLLPLWKVKASAREGFYRTYYTTTPDGDEIVIDFNNTRAMTRIQLTVASEGGRQYFCVIKSGTILQERDMTVGRPLDISSRIFPFRFLIGSIPDDMLRKAIAGNYGIPLTVPKAKRARLVVRKKPSRIRRLLALKRQRERQPLTPFQRFLRRLPAEAFQTGCVTALAMSQLHGWLTLAQFACLVGFFGLWSGAYDWVVRQTSPFLPRVAAMLAISAYSVWTQIQYSLWGIFL